MHAKCHPSHQEGACRCYQLAQLVKKKSDRSPLTPFFLWALSPINISNKYHRQIKPFHLLQPVWGSFCLFLRVLFFCKHFLLTLPRTTWKKIHSICEAFHLVCHVRGVYDGEMRTTSCLSNRTDSYDCNLNGLKHGSGCYQVWRKNETAVLHLRLLTVC